jgi:4'-phosphopantetheinyl transferase
VSAQVTVYARRVSSDPEVLAGLRKVLDVHERERAARRASPAAYVTAHALLRSVASEWTGQRPEAVAFDRACATCGSHAHGKPVLRGHEDVFVSLSYAGELAVVAVTAAGETGVDVEELVEAGFDGFEDVTLAPDERAGFDGVPAAGLAAARAQVWARKESILKASGHGLVVDPREVVVTPPSHGAALVQWRGETPLAAPVQLHDVPLPHSGYAAAVAVLTDRPVVVELRP